MQKKCDSHLTKHNYHPEFLGLWKHDDNKNEMERIIIQEQFLDQVKSLNLTETAKVVETFLENYKQRLIHVSENNYDVMNEIAQKYNLENLKKECAKVFKQKDLSYKHEKWDVIFKNEEFPWDKRTGDSYIDNLFTLQWNAFHKTPESEEAFFDEALKLGYHETCKKIYFKVLKHTLGLYLPVATPFMQATWENNLEALKVKRLNFLKKHINLLQGAFPDEKMLNLLGKTFTKTKNDPELLLTLFKYALIPYFDSYIRGDTIRWPACIKNSTLSSRELIEIFTTVYDFAQESDNSHFLKYIEDMVIDPHTIYSKAEHELTQFVEQDDKDKLIRDIRSNFYPLISSRCAAKWSEYVLGNWVGINKAPEANKNLIHPSTDFLKFEAHVQKPLDQTQYNVEATSDITLVMPDNQKIFLHREVLKKGSEYYEGLFTQNFTDSNSKEISCENSIKPEEQAAFISLLQYVYTNQVKIDSTNGPYILKLADQFRIQPMLPLIIAFNDWVNSPYTFVGATIDERSATIESAKLINLTSVYLRAFECLNDTENHRAEFYNNYGHLLTHFPLSLKNHLAFVCQTCPNLETIDWPKDQVFDLESAKELAKLKKLRNIKFPDTSKLEMAAICALKDSNLTNFTAWGCTIIENEKIDLPDIIKRVKESFPQLKVATLELAVKMKNNLPQITGSIHLDLPQQYGNEYDD